MKSIFVVVIAILIVIYEIKSDDKADEYCHKCGQSTNESRFHAYDDIFKLRWQTPRPGTEKYQESYQDYHSLVSYVYHSLVWPLFLHPTYLDRQLFH